MKYMNDFGTIIEVVSEDEKDVIFKITNTNGSWQYKTISKISFETVLKVNYYKEVK